MTKFIKNSIPVVFLILLATVMYALTLRGDIGLDGSILWQNDYTIVRGGPYEGSNSSSRYALTQSIVENNSFFLNREMATLAYPDLVRHNNNFFSIFTPGVSFLGIPFYIVGKYFGVPQIFTYLSTFFFALMNLFLIAKIAQKLGAGRFTSLFSGFIFVFATNAFSYSLTFTQHHLSTSIILLALLNAYGERNWKTNIIFGLIFGIGIFTDIPNAFLLLPPLIYVLFKNFEVINDSSDLHISVTWKVF